MQPKSQGKSANLHFQMWTREIIPTVSEWFWCVLVHPPNPRCEVRIPPFLSGWDMASQAIGYTLPECTMIREPRPWQLPGWKSPWMLKRDTLTAITANLMFVLIWEAGRNATWSLDWCLKSGTAIVLEPAALHSPPTIDVLRISSGRLHGILDNALYALSQNWTLWPGLNANSKAIPCQKSKQ